MCKGKDSKNSRRGLINMSIVMRTRWRKVAFLMIHIHSKRIKRAIDRAIRRIPIINTIIPVSRHLTQPAAARKHLPVNNSNAPKSRLAASSRLAKTSPPRNSRAKARTVKPVS